MSVSTCFQSIPKQRELFSTAGKHLASCHNSCFVRLEWSTCCGGRSHACFFSAFTYHVKRSTRVSLWLQPQIYSAPSAFSATERPVCTFRRITLSGFNEKLPDQSQATVALLHRQLACSASPQSMLSVRLQQEKIHILFCCLEKI